MRTIRNIYWLTVLLVAAPLAYAAFDALQKGLLLPAGLLALCVIIAVIPPQWDPVARLGARLRRERSRHE